MKFIWRGRPPKVAQSVLCHDVENGGLRAVNTMQLYRALRLKWVARMVTCTESKWRLILQSRFDQFDIHDLLRIRKGATFLRRQKVPRFYKEVLLDFQAISQKGSFSSALEVRSQSLWHSDEITRNKKPVFISNMYAAGIKIVNDIVAINGRILSVGEIKRRFPTVTTIFFF